MRILVNITNKDSQELYLQQVEFMADIIIIEKIDSLNPKSRTSIKLISGNSSYEIIYAQHRNVSVVRQM